MYHLLVITLHPSTYLQVLALCLTKRSASPLNFYKHNKYQAFFIVLVFTKLFLTFQFLISFFLSTLHTYTTKIQRTVFYLEPQLHSEMVKLTVTHPPSNNPGSPLGMRSYFKNKVYTHSIHSIRTITDTDCISQWNYAARNPKRNSMKYL